MVIKCINSLYMAKLMLGITFINLDSVNRIVKLIEEELNVWENYIILTFARILKDKCRNVVFTHIFTFHIFCTYIVRKAIADLAHTVHLKVKYKSDCEVTNVERCESATSQSKIKDHACSCCITFRTIQYFWGIIHNCKQEKKLQKCKYKHSIHIFWII